MDKETMLGLALLCGMLGFVLGVIVGIVGRSANIDEEDCANVHFT